MGRTFRESAKPDRVAGRDTERNKKVSDTSDVKEDFFLRKNL